MTRVVTGALEVERREKRMGGALEAAPRVHIADPALLAAFEGLDPPRCSAPARLRSRQEKARLAHSVCPRSAAWPWSRYCAKGRKCARSWRVLPEVGTDPRYPDLSLRDAEAVAWWDATHA